MKLLRLSRMNRKESVERNISTTNEAANVIMIMSDSRPGPSTVARKAKTGATIWAG